MKTVKKVIDILELFEKPNIELNIAELVELSGSNASTVYRICTELTQRGYLARSENRGKYRLGQRFLKYYHSLGVLNRLKETALVFMQELRNDINESVALSVLAGSEITDIACVTSPHKLQLLSREGEVLPLHCTSAGKMFLAQMDSDSLARIIKIKDLPRRTPNTITNINLLNKELAIIRREGISFDNEEFEVGIRSVAAQILGEEGTVVAALAVIGPSVRISIQKMQDMLPSIKQYAHEISKSIGGKP
jgi:IclR family transcriptional regulator, KDG regulon repressor